MNAEGDAVMDEISLRRTADTTRNRPICRNRNLDVIQWSTMQASQDGIHDAREQNRAENERGNASHF